MAHGEVSLAIADLINLALIPILTLVGYLHMRIVNLQKDQKEIKSSTYTKTETKEILDLTVSPIKEATDRLAHSNEKLADAITKLQISLAKERCQGCNE